MTTMALTAPPLKRLFERLDFSPTPTQKVLKAVLEQWKVAGRGTVAPSRSAVSFPEASEAAKRIFVYRVVEGERDYILVDGAKASATLLGPCEGKSRLRAAKNRRHAVRLRRLFDEARRCGQPVLAQYTLVEEGRDRALIEILAAPLSENGKAIDSILCAVSISPFETGAFAHSHEASTDSGLAIFALGSSRSLGQQVARHLHEELSPHEEREFEDGEHKTRPLVNVRDRDVYVIYSLHGEESRTGSDKLCRLLFFIGALKDAGAARVTAVVPYLCYARKDRQTKPRDPVTTRYVAQMFEAVGTDRVVVIDIHNLAAFQNAFRRGAAPLDAQAIFARYIAAEIGEEPLAVVSPDLGGEKRAELFRERMEKLLERPVAKGFMDKHRSMGKVTGEIFAGDVEGRAAIVLDDLISTGGTMARTAAACRKHGAKKVWLVATHGAFSSGAAAILRDAPFDRLLISDTVPLPLGVNTTEMKGRLAIVSIAGLLAEAIRRLHSGGSIVELLENGP
jgi:ribose-phosphate pyrophosphokinase